MSNASASANVRPRWGRLFRIALMAALSLAMLALLPAVLESLYSCYILWIPGLLRPYCQVAAVAGLGTLFVKRPGRILGVTIPEGFWNRSEAVSVVVADRVLPILLGLSTVLMLSLWLPHFLHWPWWADMDHFALAAQSWNAGRLPYRDQIDYNFPGPMFLMWLLGKTFGWGRMMPPLAVDAAMLVGLGVAMVAWSRERFGRRLPGLAASALFVCYYLTLNATLIAQRDWQATWLVVMSLMAIESLPDRRWAWPVSAFLVALSFTFRPYAVLFLPAFLSAIDARVRTPGEPIAIFVKALAWFGVVFAVMLGIVYSPLWIAGILDDFVRSLAYVVPGGAYNKNSPADFRERLVGELADWRVVWLLVPMAILAVWKDNRLGRTSRTWGLAILGAVFYRPVGPVGHHYLVIPLQLILVFGVAVILEAISAYPGWLRPSSRLLAVVVILAWFYQGVPRNCRWSETRQALAVDFLGAEPPLRPIGIESVFPIRKGAPYAYNWESYNDLLTYLRRTTTPKTLVANAFRKTPYPALNGPLGRLSPYPGPGNMAWFRWVGTGLEPDYCRALASAEYAVVVWTPGEKTDFPWMQLPRLVETIREHFRPEAKFGVMEVWRRIPRGTIPGPLPPYIPEELEYLKEGKVPPPPKPRSRFDLEQIHKESSGSASSTGFRPPIIGW